MAFRVGIALGSNLGERLSNLRKARNLLQELSPKNSHFLSAPLYQSLPIDCPPDSPDFYNTAVELDYLGTPHELLTLTQGIEYHLGRRPPNSKNAPRPIDLDILYFGDETISGDILTIPHKGLTSRRFVLQPLADIAPELVLPGDQVTIREHLRRLDGDEPALHLVQSVW